MSELLPIPKLPPSAQTPVTQPQLPALALPEPAPIIDTDPHYPPPPGVRALKVLLDRLGQGETSPNQGPVVEWACRRWAGEEWWAANYPAGKVSWCAGAVSSAFADAGVPFRGSLSCDGLLRLLQRAGWLVWQPSHTDRRIEAGDVVFWGPALDLDHVGLVETYAGGRLHCVEGNHLQQVARHSYDLPDRRLAWVARHP